MKHVLALTLLYLCTLASTEAAEPPITGAGSSAAAPIYRSWAREYQKVSGIGLAYEAVGSSAGLKRIGARDVGFGASDVAPPPAELEKQGLVVFPIAITGVAPVFNLPKLGDGQLLLDGDLLARIFLGQIDRWNAPEIARLNPGAKLPDLPIKVVVRSDGSGTTYNFADYLAKMSPAWKARNGVHTSYDWPAAFIGAKGSDGVVKAVKDTVGALGYVDYGYVLENHLKAAVLRNREGEIAKPSTASFRDALNNSEWVSRGGFATTLTDQPGKTSWPIVMGTFALVPVVPDKPAETARALRFFIWAFVNGDTLVQKNNFVRLPDHVQASAFRAIASVTDRSGASLAMGLLGAEHAPR